MQTSGYLRITDVRLLFKYENSHIHFSQLITSITILNHIFVPAIAVSPACLLIYLIKMLRISKKKQEK